MNAYLHIPFCTSICSYCDFTSFAGQEGKIVPYAEALRREIASSDLQGPLKTVYFGGGTPSLLSSKDTDSILNALKNKARFESSVEISMEMNPETVDLAKLKGFRSAGVNRISFGAQASQKGLLKRLGRGHEWDRVEEAVRQARQAGFDNLNLDLMFGLPGQTISMFQESLKKALALVSDHLSLYALQVEKGTPLDRQVSEGLKLPTEDEVADGYALAQTLLKKEGYYQYEVSNFAKPGKECCHNLNIWRGEDYWGFGVGAVGTVQGERITHGEDLGEYIRRIGSGEEAPVERECLSSETLAWERVMLGFRTQEGVPQEALDRFAKSRSLDYQSKFEWFQKEGFLRLEAGSYRATAKGYFVLNGILESLMS